MAARPPAGLGPSLRGYGEARLQAHPDGLEVVWRDGTADRFAWSWLRDACPCDRCRADGGRQRLIDITALPLPTPPARASHHGGLIRLEWAGDGPQHASAWPLAALRSWGEARRGGGPRPSHQAIAPRLVQQPWDLARDGGTALETVLAAVVDHGVALITGVPPAAEAVRDVIATFGYLRPTNYGEVFDVRAVVAPDNLANTDLSLSPHTDNPYRSPVPSVQVLHCVQSSAAGGETILVDGVAAAARLAAEAPGARVLLERWPWTWYWHDDGNELRATGPVIDAGPDGEVRLIRFNERSRMPAICPPEVASDLLGALARFAAVIADPSAQTRLRLAPGDALIMDNRRLLHGRTAFVGTGGRHLRGAYSDLDGLRSRLAVLRRTGAAGGC